MTLAATMAYILMSLFILRFIVNIKTIPVQIQEFNTSSAPSEESSTDVYSLTTTDSTGAGKNSHINMSNYEEVTHNPPVVDGLTLIPSWFTLPVETHISNNASGPPSDENKQSIDVHPLTMMLTTTDSIEIKNDSYNMSNRENSKSNLDLDSITHNPPVVDGLTLIPSWFTLPVETHISNNASGPPSDENKKSIDVHPLTTMLTTTDSIEIKNDSYNMSNRENSKSNLDLDSMTNNPPVVDGLTLIPSWFTLPVETHILSNNTSGPPSDENKKSIDVHPLTMMLTTTDSIEIKNDSYNMSNRENSKSNLDLDSSV
ncbi:uncharacterized protein LOC132939520 [Metopolophium dirhodum]|uniref:uncharacterized protein LOC132939520 n=1 Tax=Metopolophium dirhodum TaxID=44670 RepID=UPI00298FF5B6|nr:uncharacterized protein LOC132939520 [Metopolophium dirhodum]